MLPPCSGEVAFINELEYSIWKYWMNCTMLGVFSCLTGQFAAFQVGKPGFASKIKYNILGCSVSHWRAGDSSYISITPRCSFYLQSPMITHPALCTCSLPTGCNIQAVPRLWSVPYQQNVAAQDSLQKWEHNPPYLSKRLLPSIWFLLQM